MLGCTRAAWDEGSNGVSGLEGFLVQGLDGLS